MDVILIIIQFSRAKRKNTVKRANLTKTETSLVIQTMMRALQTAKNSNQTTRTTKTISSGKKVKTSKTEMMMVLKRFKLPHQRELRSEQLRSC